MPKDRDPFFGVEKHNPPAHVTPDIAEIRGDIGNAFSRLFGFLASSRFFAAWVGGYTDRDYLTETDTSFQIQAEGGPSETVIIPSPEKIRSIKAIEEMVNSQIQKLSSPLNRKVIFQYIKIKDKGWYQFTCPDPSVASINVSQPAGSTFLSSLNLETNLWSGSSSAPPEISEIISMYGFDPAVYVAGWGDDSSGTGVRYKPYRTIQKAYDSLPSGSGTIVLLDPDVNYGELDVSIIGSSLIVIHEKFVPNSAFDPSLFPILDKISVNGGTRVYLVNIAMNPNSSGPYIKFYRSETGNYHSDLYFVSCPALYANWNPYTLIESGNNSAYNYDVVRFYDSYVMMTHSDSSLALDPSNVPYGLYFQGQGGLRYGAQSTEEVQIYIALFDGASLTLSRDLRVKKFSSDKSLVLSYIADPTDPGPAVITSDAGISNSLIVKGSGTIPYIPQRIECAGNLRVQQSVIDLDTSTYTTLNVAQPVVLKRNQKTLSASGTIDLGTDVVVADSQDGLSLTIPSGMEYEGRELIIKSGSKVDDKAKVSITSESGALIDGKTILNITGAEDVVRLVFNGSIGWISDYYKKHDRLFYNRLILAYRYGNPYPMTSDLFAKNNASKAKFMLNSWNASFSKCYVDIFAFDRDGNYRVVGTRMQFSTLDEIVDFTNNNIANDGSSFTETAYAVVYDEVDYSIRKLTTIYGYNAFFASLKGTPRRDNKLTAQNSNWSSAEQWVRDVYSYFGFDTALLGPEIMQTCWFPSNYRNLYGRPEPRLILNTNLNQERTTFRPSEFMVDIAEAGMYVEQDVAFSWITSPPSTYSIHSSLQAGKDFWGLWGAVAVHLLKNDAKDHYALYVKPLGISTLNFDYFDPNQYSIEVVSVWTDRRTWFREFDSFIDPGHRPFEESTVSGRYNFLEFYRQTYGTKLKYQMKWRRPPKFYFRLRNKTTNRVGPLSQGYIGTMMVSYYPTFIVKADKGV